MDELSGLFNRRFLEETMRTRFSRAASNPPACALLMLDIDFFHSVNESYGREAGDAVISTTGAAFSRVVPESCVAARLSGDEFAFFLPDATRQEALEFAERIRTETEGLYLTFRNGRQSEPGMVHLTASIGVAASPDDATSYEDLYMRADKQLFRAKEAGRNCVRCCG
jgi:diguanylate cyclase (GGDEF)-like protein